MAKQKGSGKDSIGQKPDFLRRGPEPDTEDSEPQVVQIETFVSEPERDKIYDRGYAAGIRFSLETIQRHGRIAPDFLRRELQRFTQKWKEYV